MVAYVSSYDEPAPKPAAFPAYYDMTEVSIPSDYEFGRFSNNVDFAGLYLGENSNDLLLKLWIVITDWNSVNLKN